MTHTPTAHGIGPYDTHIYSKLQGSARATQNTVRMFMASQQSVCLFACMMEVGDQPIMSGRFETASMTQHKRAHANAGPLGPLMGCQTSAMLLNDQTVEAMA